MQTVELEEFISLTGIVISYLSHNIIDRFPRILKLRFNCHLVICITYLKFPIFKHVFYRLYSEEELPAEFKLYLPVQQKGRGPPGDAATALAQQN